MPVSILDCNGSKPLGGQSDMWSKIRLDQLHSLLNKGLAATWSSFVGLVRLDPKIHRFQSGFIAMEPQFRWMSLGWRKRPFAVLSGGSTTNVLVFLKFMDIFMDIFPISLKFNLIFMDIFPMSHGTVIYSPQNSPDFQVGLQVPRVATRSSSTAMAGPSCCSACSGGWRSWPWGIRCWSSPLARRHRCVAPWDAWHWPRCGKL